VSAALALLACAWLAAPPRFEPPPPGSYELPPFGRVGPHELLGTGGAPEPLLDLRPGEAAVVSFVYLDCPDACPLATAALQRLDRALAERGALGARASLVTVSFDPARDTPERLAALRRSLAPRGRWRFLTAASADALAPVLAEFGQDAVRAEGAAGGRVEGHVLKVFLVDARGRIRNAYSTGFLDPRILLNDVLTVLAE
jgi:cytochrome oxidase Cu insertion factor (SCO1/SenC/PrrC family)